MRGLREISQIEELIIWNIALLRNLIYLKYKLIKVKTSIQINFGFSKYKERINHRYIKVIQMFTIEPKNLTNEKN